MSNLLWKINKTLSREKSPYFFEIAGENETNSVCDPRSWVSAHFQEEWKATKTAELHRFVLHVYKHFNVVKFQARSIATELYAFDKNDQFLFKGKVKLIINKLAQFLLVEPLCEGMY